MTIRTAALLVALLASALVSCNSAPEPPGQAPGEPIAGEHAAIAALVLEREMAAIDARADSLDAVFQPLPLLRPAEEAALRRFSNAEQLSRARLLGIERGLPDAELAALESQGTLLRLDDSSRYWIVRDLDHSVPLIVPAAAALLSELGGRFHAALAEHELPPLRLEVTSVLRSAGNQTALRRTNPNAARGSSAHEFGTTVDITYAAFAAPAGPLAPIDAEDGAWAGPFLRRYAAVSTEAVAARRSRELQAILGRVLIEMQSEGKVMGTLERLQPVFHLTVAQDLSGETHTPR